MPVRTKALFTEEKQTQEGRLEKESEDTFHCQGGSNDAAGVLRKLGPIGPKLELHGNSGDNPEEKVYGKDFRPEPCGSIIRFVLFPKCQRLENDDQRCKSHRQLRKEIVIGDGEGKVQAMYDQCFIHYALPWAVA